MDVRGVQASITLTMEAAPCDLAEVLNHLKFQEECFVAGDSAIKLA